jgi:hypothetical protein
MSGSGWARSGVTLAAMRDWWLRALLVLQRPRPVFVALRDESSTSLADRSEPVLAVIILAGMAGVLSTATAGRLLDDGNYDNVNIAIWAFFGGGIYGAFAYWVLGALLHRGSKALGSLGSYRRSRHLLAFAAVPIALSLIVWPVKLAVYGDDVFRSGGSDSGTGERVFTAIMLAFVLWAAVLLVIGVRSVHGWTWARAGGACALAVLAPAVVVLAFSSL